MHKKVTSLLVAVAIASSITIPVFATPSNGRVNEQKNIINEQQQKINKNKEEMEKNRPLYEKAEAEVQKIQSEIEKLDNKIGDMQYKIQSANKKIDETNENITKSQLELDKAEADMKAEKDIFSKRARSLYMNGTDSYLEIIFNSKGLHDFISRIETLRAISNHDKKIVTEIKQKQVEISDRKNKLEQEKKETLALKAQIEADLKEVEKSKSVQDGLIKEAQAKRDQYANTISGFRERIEESERQINSAKNNIERIRQEAAAASSSSNTPSRGNSSGGSSIKVPSSGMGNAAVAIASRYLGTPYLWGGTSPGGFDCSGLVQYAYAQLGVSLPRTTYTQVNCGTAVSRNQLEPGDLVFFGSAGSPHHVGMYVGDGCYIHAPQTGDVVKVSSLSSRRDYCAGRRIR